jgi:hypothetical protein
VPGHEGIAGNETADLLARTGSEPARGISNGVAKRSARDRTNRNHTKQWEYTTEIGKGTYIRTLCRKNKGSVEIKQRPIKMDCRTIYRTMLAKGTPFQIRIH